MDLLVSSLMERISALPLPLQMIMDHGDLYENIALVLDKAKEEMQQRDRQKHSAGIVERVLMYAQNATGHSLECYFTGLIFDVTASKSGESPLDEYWLGVMQKIILLHEKNRPDTSPARIKHLTVHMETMAVER